MLEEEEHGQPDCQQTDAVSDGSSPETLQKPIAAPDSPDQMVEIAIEIVVKRSVLSLTLLDLRLGPQNYGAPRVTDRP